MALKDIVKPIQNLIDGFSGITSYSIFNVGTGEQIEHAPETIMPTASTMKVFCLVKLLKMVDEGLINLDDVVTLNSENYVRGSGILKELHLGLTITVRDACMLMVIVSDNSATNMVIDLVGGVQAVNQFIKSCGLENSQINNRVDFTKVIVPSDLAVATTGEFLKFLKLVKDSALLSEEMKKQYFDILSRQQNLDQFPRYMPYNPYAAELSLPCDVRIFNKTGYVDTVRADVGYVERSGKGIIYAVMSDQCKDHGFLPDNEANILHGRIGKLVYDEILA